ncbi:MAG TPA: ACP S-malonyltransferase [Chloroflexia bacterium]|nr:ACP S-malonyltransferase [Chloroflexia bacterium]
MTNTAWVFPGQGSQVVGMGRELAQKYPAIADLYSQADSILGYSISKLCFDGPEDQLTRTDNAQPALLLTSIAHLRVLQTYSPEILDQPPLFVAGHSLGEYTALVAAGALSLEDALKLVRLRGNLMNEAGLGENGAGSGMVAVIGADDELLEKLASENGAEVANYNSPGQTAISGTTEALARFTEAAKAAGVKRVIPLPVSAAFHSSLMKPMANKLGEAIEATSFQPASVPVVSNVTAQPLPLDDNAALKQELITQTYNPVRWVESVRTMYTGGATRFIEIGAGKVLAGLIRRIEKGVEVLNSEDLVKQL